MTKSPDAFRTISEVADWLGIQAHVLRFWESKFTQVKPIKRAGGRRYYRPNDMLLLGGIRQLLHEDGLTIKGVQKILREEGMSHVAALSQPLDDQMAIEAEQDQIAAAPPPEEKGVVLDFAPTSDSAEHTPAVEPTDTEEDHAATAHPEADLSEDTSALPDFVRQPMETAADDTGTDNMPADEPVLEAEAEAGAGAGAGADEDIAPSSPQEDTAAATLDDLETTESEEEIAVAAVPADEPDLDTAATDDGPTETPQTAAEHASPLKPRIIDIPPIIPEAEIDAHPSTLSAAFRSPGLTRDQARTIAPLLEQLTALRDRMQNARHGGAPKD
jgi:DNA-binding transcriptional MerR regulator